MLGKRKRLVDVSLLKIMTQLRQNVGWILVIVIAAVPMALWALGQPLKFRFVNPSITLTSLGQLSALVGTAMYAITLFLSTRMRFMDRWFFGINKVYKIHHNLGIFAFLLLLLHPLLLAVAYGLISWRSAAELLIPRNDWPRTVGIIALVPMMGLMIITLYGKLRYQVLKFFHQFLGLAFLIASYHILLMPSDIARIKPLRYYMVALVILGIFSYLYKTFFGRLTAKRYEFTVTAVRPQGAMFEIEMQPRRERLEYLPGQFIFISFHNRELSPEVHPFSISSAPTRRSGKVNVFVKPIGEYTKKLAELKAGTPATIEGPFGSFVFFRGEHREQVWIAGGSGIGPFIGMARSLLWESEHHGYSINLFYSVKQRNQLSGIEELLEIASIVRGFKVIPVVTDEEGFITAKKIAEKSKGLKDKEIFICAPPPMMKSLTEQLNSLGVPAFNIHTEEFQLLK